MNYDLQNVTAARLYAVLDAGATGHDWRSPEFRLCRSLVTLGAEEGEANAVAEALLAWAMESACDVPMEEDDSAPAVALVRSMAETLESISCAAGHGPGGLICNVDLWDRVGREAPDIDEALDNYGEEIGEHYTPGGSGSLTLGSLVWFAYEWNAHRLASLMRSVFGVDA